MVPFEQFIRQALMIPTKPVVVFSESPSPNWQEKDCNGKDTSDPILQEDDLIRLQNLEKDPMKIFTEINKLEGFWGQADVLFREYKMAGIQSWVHSHYEKYKCRGPYVKSWGCCSASWHPSILGHEVITLVYIFIETSYFE